MIVDEPCAIVPETFVNFAEVAVFLCALCYFRVTFCRKDFGAGASSPPMQLSSQACASSSFLKYFCSTRAFLPQTAFDPFYLVHFFAYDYFFELCTVVLTESALKPNAELVAASGCLGPWKYWGMATAEESTASKCLCCIEC